MAIKKTFHHFGQVDFNMSIVTRWSFWLVILIYEVMDHLPNQIKIIYFKFLFKNKTIV